MDKKVTYLQMADFFLNIHWVNKIFSGILDQSFHMYILCFYFLFLNKNANIFYTYKVTTK